MRFLFYFIHPAKFHAFRITINDLKNRGHTVDVAIISKDIVEDLVLAEGWDYVNIFPEGRRINWLHTYISAAVNLVRTIYRLTKLLFGKKYDLIITDDLATIVGRIKGVPTIFFTDDDLKAVPESVILVGTANHILCPSVTHMGWFSYKKIGYYGLKSLAHLHPNQFNPDRSKLHEFIRSDDHDFFFIRCVSATSTHDVGKKGLTDSVLIKIVNMLKPYGTIVINSQREIPEELKHFQLQFEKQDVAHYLAFAKIFISDSTTMCAEACILGTPSIEVDDWYSDFEQYKLLNEKYGLLYGFTSNDSDQIINKIYELVANKNSSDERKSRRDAFLSEQIDLSEFMIWLFENYPRSASEFLSDPTIQNRFK